jgi:2-keto-4-pentenoate hydratase
MSGTDARSRAHALYEARRTRKPVPPFTDDDPSLGMADGYAIPQELVAMLLGDGDRIVGHKVGLTSAPMQRMFGIDSPDYGPVLASTVYADGDTIALDRFIAPKLVFKPFWSIWGCLSGSGVGFCRPVGGRRSACCGSRAGGRVLVGWVSAHRRVEAVSRGGGETRAARGRGSTGRVWWWGVPRGGVGPRSGPGRAGARCMR